MKKIVYLIFFWAATTFGQSVSSDQLITQLDSVKSLNQELVRSITRQLLSRAKTENKPVLRNIALTKQAESLTLFNQFESADSVLSLVAIDTSSHPVFLDYLFTKGKILAHKKENNLALDIYYELLSINNQNASQYRIAETYLEIANVLRSNNDLENCTKYFRFAMIKAKEDNHTGIQVKACTQLCKVYNGWITLDLDSSVYYGEKAIAIALEANDEYHYADAISVVAAPLIRVGQVRRGLAMSKEALSYADKYNFSLQSRYYLISNQAFAHNDLKMYDSARFYMMKAGELRKNSIDFSRLKYRILKAQGNFEEALAAFEVYQKAYAETVKNRHQTNLSTLQARYETNIKEQELATLAQKTKAQDQQLIQQRHLLIGSILFIAMLIAGMVLLYRQRKLNKKQLLTHLELKETRKRLSVEKQYRAAELKAIRSQMNPHFVFNALNSIQEYIMANEKAMAGKYLGKFADLMRIYLNHSQVKEVTIDEEIQAIRLYLDLEKMRFDDKLSYHFTIDDELDLEAKIPSFMGQPYVENAIKHGLLHKKDDRHLNLSFSINDNHTLIYSIEDNGIGREASAKINQVRAYSHRSFSTSANRSRLELLNEERDHAIVEEIIDLKAESGQAGGTKIVLKIPLN